MLPFPINRKQISYGFLCDVAQLKPAQLFIMHHHCRSLERQGKDITSRDEFRSIRLQTLWEIQFGVKFGNAGNHFQLAPANIVQADLFHLHLLSRVCMAKNGKKMNGSAQLGSVAREHKYFFYKKNFKSHWTQFSFGVHSLPLPPSSNSSDVRLTLLAFYDMANSIVFGIARYQCIPI